MNCNKFQQWLSLDMDGELSASHSTLLQEHLESCPACRRLKEEWGMLGQHLRESTVAPAQTPEAAWADVHRAIRLVGDAGRKAESLSVFGARLRWIGAGLTAVAALFVAFILVRPMMEGGVRPAAAVAQRASTEVEMVETGLPGATPMVYEDAESGLTVIWVVEANHKEPGHVGS